MTNLQSKVTQTIDDFYTDYEIRNIIKQIMVKYDIEELSDFDSMSTPDLQNVILDFEQSGATGFDCGFSKIVIMGKSDSDYQELKTLTKQLKKSDNYKFDTFIINEYPEIKNSLEIYVTCPLNVQSTTINQIQLTPLVHKLQEVLNPNFIVYCKIKLD